MARKSHKCKSCSSRVSEKARRRKWVMELLLDTWCLSPYGPVLQATVNEELGETSQRKSKDILLDLNPRTLFPPLFHCQETFLQLLCCTSRLCCHVKCVVMTRTSTHWLLRIKPCFSIVRGENEGRGQSWCSSLSEETTLKASGLFSICTPGIKECGSRK